MSGTGSSGTSGSPTAPRGAASGGAPTLPPGARSRVFQGLTAAAARGRFELQQCAHCQAVQYPPREACHRCLSTELPWTLQTGAGELIAQTTLFHSHEAFFSARTPWRVGLIRLDCGPSVVAHVHAAVGAAPARVRIVARLDRSAQAVLVAVPDTAAVTVIEDGKLAEILLPAGG